MSTFLTTLLRLLRRLWQRLALHPLTDPPTTRPTMSNPPAPYSRIDPSLRVDEELGPVVAQDHAARAEEIGAATVVDASIEPQPVDHVPVADDMEEEHVPEADAAEAEEDAIEEDATEEETKDAVAQPRPMGDEPASSTNGATPPDASVLSMPTMPAPLIPTEEGELSLTAMLESLLFVAEAPVAAAQIAPLLDLPVETVEAGLQRLSEQYRSAERGLRVQRRDGEYALVSAPATATLIERFLNLDLTTKLSGPALETLAIVAYRQPVTRAQVEAVRGVDCSGMLRSLLQRGLVEEMGRVEAVGRPLLYGVTDEFMNHFGLTEMGELPPLAAEDVDALQSALSLGEEEVDSA